MVVMDVFTRRIIGFGVDSGRTPGAATRLRLPDVLCSASLTCSGVICLFSVTFETLSSALTADSRPSNHRNRPRRPLPSPARSRDRWPILAELYRAYEGEPAE